MPLGEAAGEALSALVRGVGRLVVDVVLEFVIQGTGHVLIRAFRPNAQPGEFASGMVGLCVWIVFGVGCYVVFRTPAP